ncbi:aminotransferase class IV [Streptomyces europaeiscabiei]|uniref:aminotransferase class IV n=1 Tax=Streptomyces europaeiscabiei TaxID=146819 RepID=UPI0029AA0A84|nr:aminotransferase class IV [Streptomyces europaeiscabiei]MDX3580861.1 aminotransferase class IV [Streptomyces europaeiscabiei]MDX3615847.1 aminotransferase class IV [Streptomyces europaeiscabiei]MDX3630972.1 aminotransferase class IV [Streptomyces europaeiscabiei]MDX3649014.1 aminotransferase class IV [Streptomyces europaeiscabiei]WUD37451.1 aminotransferase class IV [Streptomyces europaeiscabiei]
MTPPAIAEGLSTWSPEHGLVPVQAQGGRLLVADSWLLRDGRVRGFDRHRERFLRSCGECGAPPLGQVVDFWQDMTRALPRTGEWFPRVELASGSLELRLLLRPAPPLAADVRVWAAGQPDPRTVPRRKGPDLDALARVRRRASGADAEEAVLIAPSGLVLEAANSSLFWWEDDTLCLPPPRLPLLAGVTMALVQERAARTGVRIAHRERSLAELAGVEVWLVNALHGIRPVAAWTGRPMAPGPAVHAPEWRKWLDGLMEPLPDH